MELINIIHKKIRIKGLKDCYTFLHITDMHMVCFGETEMKTRVDYAKPRLKAFSRNGITPDVCLRAYIQYANSISASGVLMTGDIMDFPSPENIAALHNALSELKGHYVFVPGNHDWSYFDNYHTEDSIHRERPLLRQFCEGDEDFHTKLIGELMFVALDNSMDIYRPGTAERLKEVLDSSENVIVLQHVPLFCDTLHEDTVREWGRDITLGGAAIVKDNSANEIRDMLLSSPSVKAILCGHLHFAHEDLLGGVLPQYVSVISSDGVTLLEICG